MCDLFCASGHLGNASATYTHEYDLNTSLPVLPQCTLAVSAAALSLVIRRSSRRPLPPPVRRCSCPEGRKGSRVSQRCMNVISRKGGRVSGGGRERKSALTAPFPFRILISVPHSPLSFHAASVLSLSFFRASRRVLSGGKTEAGPGE